MFKISTYNGVGSIMAHITDSIYSIWLIMTKNSYRVCGEEEGEGVIAGGHRF